MRLYETFDAAPVESLERAYSLEEVRDNYELRQRMRQVELANIVMVFLLAVIVTAARFGRGPAIVAASSNVLAFDFFFVIARSATRREPGIHTADRGYGFRARASHAPE